MYTEDEAKEKWCPMTGHDPQRNLHGLHPSQACSGSLCNWWRWGKHSRFAKAATDAPKVGYCGLAGKPEETS